MLELRHINKAYANGRQVLSDLSYTLRAGEYVAIMGESGVGKSTLLNVLGCLDRPSTGEYLLDSEAVSNLSDDQLSSIRTVGMRCSSILIARAPLDAERHAIRAP